MSEKKSIKISIKKGKIIISRGTKEENDVSYRFIESLTSDKEILNEIKDFFSGSEDIILISGDRIYCG